MCVVYIHKEFDYESNGERILKIGPHLPKLLANIKWLGLLLRHSVYHNTIRLNQCYYCQKADGVSVCHSPRIRCGIAFWTTL